MTAIILEMGNGGMPSGQTCTNAANDSAGSIPQPRGLARADVLNLAIVLTFSALAGILLWTKLHTLPWMDPAWWLQEMARYAQGQVPYRDYYWPYPPLALFIFGTGLRVFGQSFGVAQVLVDLFSLAIMLGIYGWTRRLLPAGLQALSCVLVLAVCATTQTYFSLFSFLTYGPVLHVSAPALLLLWLGVLRYLKGSSPGNGMAMMAIGAGVALATKQESLFAVVAAFGLLALWERRTRLRDEPAGIWIRQYALMTMLWFGPAACLFLLVGWWAGYGNMLLALQGNGLTKLACPWWPTGFALLAAAGGLGLTLLVAVGCTLVDARRWKVYLGRKRYAGLLLAAIAGGGVYFFFVTVSYPGTVFGGDSLLGKLSKLAPELLSTTAVFRPVLWAMIVYWLYLSIRLFRAGTKASVEMFFVLLAVTIPVSLGLRSLFGSYLTPVPEVPAICYPFVVVLTPYVLLRWLRLPYGSGSNLRIDAPLRPAASTVALMLAYIAIRLIGGYSILSNRQFTRLETPAGPVRVREGEVNRRIISYVLAETHPSDRILEIPYGGGVAFATRRPSISFTTLWRQGVVPEVLQQLDLKKLREYPPEVVIASSSENFGSYYGMQGNNACAFPELVWMPYRLSWRPGYVYPAIRWIQANYRVDRQVGDWLLLRPRTSANALLYGPAENATSTQ